MSSPERWLSDYCGLGIHRTGTAVDQATTTWFADELAALGGRVERQPYEFDRFVGEVSVTIDGQEVESDLLYYEAVGAVASSGPRRAGLSVMGGHGVSAELGREIAASRASGVDVLVVATAHPHGELVQPNREPRLGSGLPVVLVAGRHAEALLSDVAVSVDATAAMVAGRSDNVIATFGTAESGSGERPIVLATPLSGWFTCAAERGTGIAVLLESVRQLAGHHPLVVVGATGHELLPHVGLDRLLATASAADVLAAEPALVVHLGANVAVATVDPRTGERSLAPGFDRAPAGSSAGRGAFLRAGEHVVASVTDALATADLRPVVDPLQWLGEGALWAAATGGPLLSLVGTSPWFHTPADVPDRSTDPASLERVATALADVADAVVAGGGP